MNNIELRIRVLLSLQRAFLGEITPNIRGITCSWDKSTIQIKCFFHGKIKEEDFESMSCVETEVMADFPEFQIKLECVRLDFPEPLNPYALSAWVYNRKEDL